MRVSKYIPDKMYGFCVDGSIEVFFHLGVFQPGPDTPQVSCPTCPGPPRCTNLPQAPPPVLGEDVHVVFESEPGSLRAPRATRVERVAPPQILLGLVQSFDPVRRYGFIQGTDHVTYHLHQSEIVDGKLPLVGDKAVFFPGVREGKPRACHVKVCR